MEDSRLRLTRGCVTDLVISDLPLCRLHSSVVPSADNADSWRVTSGVCTGHSWALSNRAECVTFWDVGTQQVLHSSLGPQSSPCVPMP